MRLTTVATVLALLAIPTIANAHAGNHDPNMVHVCIGNVSKVVRSVGVGGLCIPGPPILAETADHWAKQATAGPKGDKGDKGDQGIQGIQGAQGNPGTNGTNGIDGANGTNGTSVRFVGYVLPGDANCKNGGAVYAAGIPLVHAYVCNGTSGIDGANGTRADGRCFDNSNRYVDCGNGTVTDTVTGLIWLQQADCLGSNDWTAANMAAAGLKEGDCNLTDGSSAGDWRLPTADEWSATIARAVALGCTVFDGFGSTHPSLTNDPGTDCLLFGPSSFAGVASIIYWSGSGIDFEPLAAKIAALAQGLVAGHGKGTNRGVWPVRGGAR